MIEVTQLVKTYGEKEALRSISFSVPPGQVCGYLGPNGAGKSTTVKILTGTLRPTSGRAVVAGFDVVEEPLEVKKRIGYVPETGAVYSALSANEYLALVGALHGLEPEQVAASAQRALRLFQLEDAADRLLDTLSKGMRQKVVISAALLHDPEVVLFDEPLSGLDANAAHTIKDLLRSLAARGKTILFCSHMLDVVERLCDHVLILHEGQIVAQGSTREVIVARQAGTLESVFRSLTEKPGQEDLAKDFLEVIEREKKA